MQENSQTTARQEQDNLLPLVAVASALASEGAEQGTTTNISEDSASSLSPQQPSVLLSSSSSSPLDTETENGDSALLMQPLNPTNESPPPPPSLTISKNQRRRLMRRERMLQRKVDRKQQKKDQRMAIAMAEGRDLEAERQQEAERAATGEGKRRQNEFWQTVKLPLAKQSFQIALDCSFESQMMEREIASLSQQLRYCYAYNKKANTPCLVGVTSLEQGSETLTRLQKETGFEEWANRLFTRTDKALEEYYADQLSKVVYLTSDSETILDTLEDDKIYVIGGIVDRNRLKGVAMNRAQALGLKTAKLPLDDHLAKMSSTPVLACNHVFNILIKTREYGNDWSKALEEILPTRKDPVFKKRTSDDIDDDGEEDVEDKQPETKSSKLEAS